LRRMVTVPTGDEATDRDLLERFASEKEQDSFARLVDRHGAMVLGVCRRILHHEQDAEDAFQATFLVLARKAGSAAWHESVGNWLWGVANRTASKVRVQAARRRHHELAQTAAVSPAAKGSTCSELRIVVDEELLRLPKKFRMPLLLCCLQDRTIDE